MPVLLKAGAPPVSINVVGLRERIRTIWELPGLRPGLTSNLHPSFSTANRYLVAGALLDRVPLLLERMPPRGSRVRRAEIVDGPVATSVDSWRFVAPRKWAVLDDSHDCIHDTISISSLAISGCVDLFPLPSSLHILHFDGKHALR